MTNFAGDSFWLRQALQAHRAGEFSAARQAYEMALLQAPDSPRILFNFGLLLLRLSDFAHAASCFENCLKLAPLNISAQYYLANCHFHLDKLSEARAGYEKIISQHPDHVDALNNLGALLLKQGETEQALQCFAAILSTHPEHQEARNNMAGTLFYLQRYAHAAQHYQQLLTLQPEEDAARYSYALALLNSEQFELAISEFEHFLQRNPTHAAALGNVGITWLKLGDKIKAEQFLSQSLQYNPQQPEIDYLYRALKGKNPPSAAPAAYIKNLFNQYAKYYEVHMADTLHYQVPRLLKNCWQHYGNQRQSLSVADLGCGTGLSGLAFKEVARTLIGIDISPQMLTLAKHKNIYDRLIESDVMTALCEAPGSYDLLIAADTFNYFGDFATLFQACYDALHESGELLFSAEKNDLAENAWILQANARYAHRETYIRQCAEATGFHVQHLEPAILREQAGQPVKGLVVLLRKN